MPRILFSATWTEQMQKDLKIPKGYLVLRYDPAQRKKIGEYLIKLDENQSKRLTDAVASGKAFDPADVMRKLDIQIEFHYRARTMNQNALMWALYEIEANEQNAGMSGHKDQIVTGEQLYETDLKEFGEREMIRTKRKNFWHIADEYRVIASIKLETGTDLTLEQLAGVDDSAIIEVTVIRSTSHFTTKEMAEWIERQFNRLAYAGISLDSSAAIGKYWTDWKNQLNKKEIILNNGIMTKDEYREAVLSCEACSKMIGHKGGELAHIKSVGMGNDRADEAVKSDALNWLHLCTECHHDQHINGWSAFVSQYPHLKHKVESALKKDIVDTYENDFVLTADPIEKKKIEETTPESIKKAYNLGMIEKGEACLMLEGIGGDPTEIDKNWIGIF